MAISFLWFKFMNINILKCDSFPGLLPADIPSYEWMFEQRFNAAAQKLGLSVSYCLYNVHQGELPHNFEADEIYLVTGSNTSAYDTIPWVLSLQDWIRQAYAQQVVLVGICFGHQVIAQALGGKVQRHPQGWGVGIRQSQVLDPALASIIPGGTMHLICNHHDQVVQLPPRANRLATSEFCVNEGYTIDGHVITFQGHPEFTVGYEEHLILHHADSESADLKNHALDSLKLLQHHGDRVMEHVLTFAAQHIALRD